MPPKLTHDEVCILHNSWCKVKNLRHNVALKNTFETILFARNFPLLSNISISLLQSLFPRIIRMDKYFSIGNWRMERLHRAFQDQRNDRLDQNERMHQKSMLYSNESFEIQDDNWRMERSHRAFQDRRNDRLDQNEWMHQNSILYQNESFEIQDDNISRQAKRPVAPK